MEEKIPVANEMSTSQRPAIEVLQKILGHADITTTINTYGYIYSYLRQKELNQKYTKYMQYTNAILEENFERFEEEYLKVKYKSKFYF